jgi:regulator of ribosome biosynthesis
VGALLRPAAAAAPARRAAAAVAARRRRCCGRAGAQCASGAARGRSWRTGRPPRCRRAATNDQLDYDLGNLCAHDPAPINPEDFQQDREAKCLEIAQAITQSLVAKLFELPSSGVQGGRVAQLPKPTSVLPREKPVPKPKPLTKWQKFAQKKGIVKHKRSKLVYDEDAGEWRRRHGYKKAGDINDIQVVEAEPGAKVGEDPFTEMEKAKRARVKKNNQQQADNIKGALKAGHKQALPVTLKLAASLPTVGKGAPQKRKELREDIKALSRHSGISTASMGKFDRRLKGARQLGWGGCWCCC